MLLTKDPDLLFLSFKVSLTSSRTFALSKLKSKQKLGRLVAVVDRNAAGVVAIQILLHKVVQILRASRPLNDLQSAACAAITGTC